MKPMKSFILLLTITLCTNLSFAQKIDYNLDNGYIADGYDVVAYFSNQALEGKVTYSARYNGAKYKFANSVNFEKFKSNPSKYAPQYGGWCAYAMGAKNKKVSIDAETFEIRAGKLYLFYNSWGNNTLESWLEENPTSLKKKADINWQKTKYTD